MVCREVGQGRGGGSNSPSAEKVKWLREKSELEERRRKMISGKGRRGGDSRWGGGREEEIGGSHI